MDYFFFEIFCTVCILTRSALVMRDSDTHWGTFCSVSCITEMKARRSLYSYTCPQYGPKRYDEARGMYVKACCDENAALNGWQCEQGS